MGNYATKDTFALEKINNNDSNRTYGSNQSDVYNWLADISIPPDDQVCNIIEIKFKGSRKEFYINHKNIDFKNGELAVVEGNLGGHDVGHVSLIGQLVHLQLKKKKIRIEDIIKKIYRKATIEDTTNWKLAKAMERDTLHKARVIAKELGLSMKLTDVDYQGDKAKATFYYTAEGRVDFRELIKNLSESFHIRIEMRQIGMREEANRIGDIGPCGSYLCCQTWSSNFKTDSPFVTRKQNVDRREGKKFECCIKDESDDNQLSKSDDSHNETYPQKKSAVVKPLTYVNVVGQDSITRFDAKGSKRKNNNQKHKQRFIPVSDRTTNKAN
jgi:cell fate regulator YaaT (PSP1 superfamily)